MSDSLKNQLLGLGFKPVPKPDKPIQPVQSERRASASKDAGKPVSRDTRREAGHPAARRDAPDARRSKPRAQGEMDLGKAYALRAETEKREREALERVRQEAARMRREAKTRLDVFLVGKALNDARSELVRHFPYGGKIKRIHVNAEQLKALNAGELGVVQSNGRYLLVSATILAEVKSIFSEAIALEIDPNTPLVGQNDADPHHQVPDDLIW